MDLKERCKKIKLLMLDVDGVLTDGRLYYGPNGEVVKPFYVRDGYGLKLWHEAGFQSGIISGRNSDIVSFRAAELKMSFIYQGNDDKIASFDKLMAEAGVSMDEIAFVGDDTLDIPVFERDRACCCCSGCTRTGSVRCTSCHKNTRRTRCSAGSH